MRNGVSAESGEGWRGRSAAVKTPFHHLLKTKTKKQTSPPTALAGEMDSLIYRLVSFKASESAGLALQVLDIKIEMGFPSKSSEKSINDHNNDDDNNNNIGPRSSLQGSRLAATPLT